MLVPHTIHLVGDSAAHAISAGAMSAKVVQYVIPAGVTTARIGGQDCSATVGLPLAAGSGFMLPPIAEEMEFWDLSQTYYYLGSGDTMDILWG